MDIRTHRYLTALVEDRAVAEHAHDRCADGTHWNDKKGACAKIPGALKTFSAAAHKRSKHADSDAINNDAGPLGMFNAMGAHTQAQVHHELAADEADKRGFTELGAEHRKHAARHKELADVLGVEVRRT